MACLLIDKNEAEHGPTEAPLVGAVLKQHNLKERRKKRWQQFRALPQVLCKCLHARNTQHFLHNAWNCRRYVMGMSPVQHCWRPFPLLQAGPDAFLVKAYRCRSYMIRVALTASVDWKQELPPAANLSILVFPIARCDQSALQSSASGFLSRECPTHGTWSLHGCRMACLCGGGRGVPIAGLHSLEVGASNVVHRCRALGAHHDVQRLQPGIQRCRAHPLSQSRGKSHILFIGAYTGIAPSFPLLGESTPSTFMLGVSQECNL